MRILASLNIGALVGMMLIWLQPGPTVVGESFALGYDLIGETEQVLKRAALESRDIYDITFLLEQAMRASEKLNNVAKYEYAEQALSLLQRAVRRGHFHPGHIEPVLALIRRLLPNVVA